VNSQSLITPAAYGSNKASVFVIENSSSC